MGLDLQAMGFVSPGIKLKYLNHRVQYMYLKWYLQEIMMELG